MTRIITKQNVSSHLNSTNCMIFQSAFPHQSQHKVTAATKCKTVELAIHLRNDMFDFKIKARLFCLYFQDKFIREWSYYCFSKQIKCFLDLIFFFFRFEYGTYV